MERIKKYFLVILAALMFITAATSQVNAEAASKVKPGTVTLADVTSTAYNKVTINWQKTSNATNYRIYYRKNGSSKWIRIATVNSSQATYTHKSSKKYPIVVGQKYNYTVRAYNSKSKQAGGYNKKGLTVKTVPNTVTLKSASVSGKNIKVTWKKAAGANYYLVYRKTANSSWKRIGTTKSLSYTDKKASSGTTYYYTVRGYYSKTKALGGYNKNGVSAIVGAAAKSTATAAKTTSKCSHVYNITIIPNGMASYAAYIGKEAGTKTYTCKKCGYSYTEKYTSLADSDRATRTYTEAEIYQRVIRLKSQYPQGSKWNKYDFYYFERGNVYCLYSACGAFATMLQDQIWEDMPFYKYTDYNKLRVGDVVYYKNSVGGHGVFILKKTSRGYIVAEGNIGNNGNGKVSWNRLITYSEMKRTFNYGWTRQPLS